MAFYNRQGNTDNKELRELNSSTKKSNYLMIGLTIVIVILTLVLVVLEILKK